MNSDSILKKIHREIAIVRVQAEGADLESALELVGAFSGRLLVLGVDGFTAEVSGEPAKVDRLVGHLTPYGLCGYRRSGVLTL